MIDKTEKFKTFDEVLAYHEGWLDGFNEFKKIKEDVEKRADKIERRKSGKK